MGAQKEDLSDRCFPPSYKIIHTFISSYHDALTNHLKTLIENTLSATEIFHLLQWVTQYRGKECLGMLEELTSDSLTDEIFQTLPSLLDEESVTELTTTYVQSTADELSTWIKRCMAQETKEWYEQKALIKTNENYLVSYLPHTFEAMMSQSLEVATNMGQATTDKLLSICLTKSSEFKNLLASEIVKYVNKYFDNISNRNEMRGHFTKQMVANANNCESFPFILSIISKKFGSSVGPDNGGLSWQPESKFAFLVREFTSLAEFCCQVLIREIDSDLTYLFVRLMTNDWFTDTDGSSSTNNTDCIVDTCIATFDDYYHNEYVHLKRPLLHYVCFNFHLKILKHFLRGLTQCNQNAAAVSTFGGILTRTVAPTTALKINNAMERRKCANKLAVEADKLIASFRNRDPSFDKDPYQFDLLKIIAEILRASDPDSITLELAALHKREPSLNIDQAISIIALRGDFSRNEAKMKAESAGIGKGDVDGLFARLSFVDEPFGIKTES